MNAERLLEDARILRRARRYSSAAALAVLSLEELGKFIAHHDGSAEWISPALYRPRRQLTHTEKQKLAGEALLWVMCFDEVRAFVDAQGCTFELRPLGSGQQNLIESVSQIVSMTDDQTYDTKIAGKIRNCHHNKFVAKLLRGHFETVKQACFYADLERDGSVTIPSKAVDRATADRFLRLAAGAIHSTKQVLRRKDKSAATTRAG